MSSGYATRAIVLTNILFLPCLVLADMALGQPKVAFAAAGAYTIAATAAFVGKSAVVFARESLLHTSGEARLGAAPSASKD